MVGVWVDFLDFPRVGLESVGWSLSFPGWIQGGEMRIPSNLVLIQSIPSSLQVSQPKHRSLSLTFLAKPWDLVYYKPPSGPRGEGMCTPMLIQGIPSSLQVP